ncbi:MAG: ATP-binding cassette domain-containing protein [Anaerolineae bacterium]
MIRVEGLVKEYGTFRALDDVSFHVARGEIVGFLGPNGAGKTTTMRTITAYMPPTDGTVEVAGLDVVAHSLEVRQRVGYLPETVPLYREMRVSDYLAYAAALRGVEDRDAAVSRVVEACGLGDVRDRIIGRLSKGYRQRVGLAQALVHDPELLVLDEPTIGLDPRQIRSVRELIRDLAGDHTVLLSTHILPEVAELCQRVLIIDKGRIVAEDTPDRLQAGLQGGQMVRVQIAQPGDGLLDALEEVPGVATVRRLSPDRLELSFAPETDGRAAVAETLVRGGWGLLEMQSVSMSLEDVFVQLTTDESTALAQEEAVA